MNHVILLHAREWPEGPRIRTIHVTQADIDSGWRLDSKLCPLATALTREYGQEVEVFPTTARRGMEYITLPPAVAEWRSKFDWIIEFRYYAAKPFSFELDDSKWARR